MPTYCETGLAKLRENTRKRTIWPGYQENLTEDRVKGFYGFIKAIGVMIELKVIESSKEKKQRKVLICRHG